MDCPCQIGPRRTLALGIGHALRRSLRLGNSRRPQARSDGRTVGRRSSRKPVDRRGRRACRTPSGAFIPDHGRLVYDASMTAFGFAASSWAGGPKASPLPALLRPARPAPTSSVAGILGQPSTSVLLGNEDLQRRLPARRTVRTRHMAWPHADLGHRGFLSPTQSADRRTIKSDERQYADPRSAVLQQRKRSSKTPKSSTSRASKAAP